MPNLNVFLKFFLMKTSEDEYWFCFYFWVIMQPHILVSYTTLLFFPTSRALCICIPTYLPAWQTKCGFYHLSHTMIVLFSAKKFLFSFLNEFGNSKLFELYLIFHHGTWYVLLWLQKQSNFLPSPCKCRGTTCRWFGGMLLTYLSTYKQNSKILIFHSHPTTYVMMSHGAVLTGARFICSVPYLFHRGSSAWPPYNTISVVISSWLDLKIKQLPQCDDEMFA